ncbi:MAG TPA: DUF3025 domain-containing protein [Polyangiaceae bacterium]|jgi:hypothetical protein
MNFLTHPAFSSFEPSVRERLVARGEIPSPDELGALMRDVPSARQPWFEFELQDEARVRAAGGFDRYIAETARIPTRKDSFHDLFGALIWLHFPKLKTAIHQVQLAAEPSVRGARQHAATHFDESGVIVASTDERVFRAIAELDWPGLFWQRREALRASTRFLCFGHGLLDALREPHPKILGMAWFARVSAAQFELGASELRGFLDRELSQRASAFLCEPAQLSPLPALGIPNWASPQTPEFYANEAYFRRARQRPKASTGASFVELAP